MVEIYEGGPPMELDVSPLRARVMPSHAALSWFQRVVSVFSEVVEEAKRKTPVDREPGSLDWLVQHCTGIRCDVAYPHVRVYFKRPWHATYEHIESGRKALLERFESLDAPVASVKP